MALSTTTTTPSGWANDAAYSNWQKAQQIAATPYQQYNGNLLAGWNQGQQQAYNSVLNGMGTGQGAMAQGQAAAQSAAAFQAPQVSAQGYTPAMQGVMNTAAASAGPATSWGVTNTAAANAGPAQQMAAAQMARGDVRDVNAGKFTDANLSSYMNPYTGAVIDTTLSRLGRENDVLQNQANARATTAGAFGGSRQAVMNSENNRNFIDTAASTIAGLNNQNFSQAQQAIQADQNRALQAGGMNQQADLTVGQANLANRQAAGLQNMLAGNNMAQFNAGLNQTALSQTAAAHNAAATQQASNANQMNQFNASLQQGALTNTAAAHNSALANQAQALNSAGQFNSDLGLRAQLANQSAAQNAINTNLSAGNALNGMGLDQQQQQLNAANASYNMGQGRTGYDQTGLDQQYAQWAAQQAYPQQQLALLQSGLAGVPYGQTSTSPQYSNTAANVLAGGLGVGALLANGSNIVSGAKSLYNGASSLMDWFG